jgi:hypothetical protein
MRLMRTFAIALVLGAALIPTSFAAKAETFTGTVSDAMCGAKHMMEGDDAACLRACVQKGSKYALVVGDKLDKLAAAKATVKGTADGDTIEVSSVAPAK